MESLPQTPFPQGHWTPVQHQFTPVYAQAVCPLLANLDSTEGQREAQRLHDEARAEVQALVGGAAGYDEADRRSSYWARMAGALAARYDGALKQRDAAQAETAKARAEAAALRKRFSAPAGTLSAEWMDVVFEVKGTFHREEIGDREEPGCSAWFEVEGVYLSGTECSQALDKPALDALEADCLRQCEQRGRDAAAARRWPDLAAEVL